MIIIAPTLIRCVYEKLWDRNDASRRLMVRAVGWQAERERELDLRQHWNGDVSMQLALFSRCTMHGFHKKTCMYMLPV